MTDVARIGRGLVDRIIDAIELVAGGFLAIATALTFVSVLLRYFFAWSIPDAYDLTSLLLGVLIFWGVAGAGYRGDHITVDLVWAALPEPIRRTIAIMADFVTFGCMAVFTWMMALKVIGTRADNIQTFDLRQPVWIYYALAWLGLAASVALLCVRLVRQFTAPQLLAPKSAAELVE